MTDKSIWNQPIPVPESVISFVDEAVKECKYFAHHALQWRPFKMISATDGTY